MKRKTKSKRFRMLSYGFFSYLKNLKARKKPLKKFS